METNWYTITSFRQLALNASTSIEKGQRVVVAGRLRIREWDNGERVGTTVEIEADSIGHDLLWGTSTFTRSIVSSPARHDENSRPEESAREESARAENAGAESAGAEPAALPSADDVERDPGGAEAEALEAEESVPF